MHAYARKLVSSLRLRPDTDLIDDKIPDSERLFLLTHARVTSTIVRCDVMTMMMVMKKSTLYDGPLAEPSLAEKKVARGA